MISRKRTTIRNNYAWKFLKTRRHPLVLSVKSLLSTSQTSNTNVTGLASIMANITLSYATDALNYIQGLIDHTINIRWLSVLNLTSQLFSILFPKLLMSWLMATMDMQTMGSQMLARKLMRVKTNSQVQLNRH